MFREGNSIVLNTIRPNPFVDQITISISLQKGQIIKVLLVESSGRIVYQKEEKGLAGLNEFNLSGLANLPKGLYLVKIQTTEAVFQHKLIK